MFRRALLFCLPLAVCLPAQEPASREMNDLNWQEFRQLVPARIETVLLPTGTMEAHGAINNGADNTAPLALARAMAKDLNALVAPLIPYGVTGALDGYPGTFQIGEAAYRAFVTDVLTGLARQGFKNIIVVNGHGGPQTAILAALGETVGRAQRVRILGANWWAICSDVTLRIFGEDGGHAGWNETAFVQAIDRTLVKPQLYSKDLELPRAPAGSWAAFPHPAPVILYQPGQGSVRFDQAKADAYFAAVVERMIAFTRDIIARWDRSKLFP
jgi:creatinine amidohydrolase